MKSKVELHKNQQLLISYILVKDVIPKWMKVLIVLNHIKFQLILK